jgi:uncharacterized membrane protein YhaH (DUF805 family)
MDNNPISDEVLLSFEGRINRAEFCYALYVGTISCLVRLVFLVFVVFTLDAIFGTSIKSFHLLFYAGATSLFVFAIRIPAASAVKRLHDRDKSGGWIVPFCIVPIVLGIGANWLGDSWSADLLMLAMVALGLWGFVEILCLRGTSGPNRFGPDPLAPAQRSPRAAPNWEQLRKLEFVRRGAGPSPGQHVKRGHD